MASHHERPLPLVLDWDGTVTERDGLHMVIERFGDVGVFDALEDALGETLTLDEVIAAEMATIRAPFGVVRDWLVEHVRIRAGFRDLVAEHDPLIVSSGFRELIDPILEREGVDARVVANSVTARNDGWRATFAEGPLCEVCGERCKRSTVSSLGRFAYAGDGYSDRCVALAADVRFARDGLAAWLDEQRVPYARFDDLHDIRSTLDPAGEGDAGDGRGG